MSPCKSSSLMYLPEYCTILAQAMSTDGEMLAVGEERGRIDIFRTEDIVERRKDDDQDEVKVKPRVTWHLGKPVLAMQATERHLIVGSTGELLAFSWDDLSSMKTSDGEKPKPDWTANIVPEYGGGRGGSQQVDVNCLCGDPSPSTAGQLVLGGGDGCVRLLDVETSTVVDRILDHSDFVHGVSMCPESGLIASAGEDGSVCLWDRRKSTTTGGRGSRKGSNSAVQKVTPFQHKSLQRSKVGKWVGAVAISGEWMVCGGGPKACLWHLRTLSPGDPFEACEELPVHVAGFVSDRIYVGGAENKLYQMGLTGEILSQITLSSSRAYSVVARPSPPFDFLSCAGSSSRIDICSPSLSYKDRTLTCFDY